MAETITLTYSAGNLSCSGSFPNGSGARAIAAASARLGVVGTNAQVFNAIANEIFTALSQQTLNVEKQAAATTAIAGVAAMPLS